MNNGHSPYLFQFYSFEGFKIEEKKWPRYLREWKEIVDFSSSRLKSTLCLNWILLGVKISFEGLTKDGPPKKTLKTYLYT